MTYLEAVEWLGRARHFGIKLGLEGMRAMADRMGAPEAGLKFIHIAGTNGKGSTAAYCEAGLRAAGFRVGLFTSPHLTSVRERIQVNQERISEGAFAEGMTAVKCAAEEASVEPTFFEIVTALALWKFRDAGVDWVVWETGMGGRLDATNIVRAEVAIITEIGFDHERWLGSTLAAIAGEKAGILKPGTGLLVSAETKPEARGVIEGRARELNLPTKFVCDSADRFEDLRIVQGKQWARLEGVEVELGLYGPHQTRNAACAWAALRALGLSVEVVKTGLKAARWPGRFDIFSEQPLMVLDGAHNEAGAGQLALTWKAYLRAKYGWSESETLGKTHLVFYYVKDKEAKGVVRELRPLAKRVSLVRFSSERAENIEILAELFAGLPVNLYGSVGEFLNEFKRDDDGGPVLVAGSLFLVGEVLAVHRGELGEYEMNELLESSAKGVGYGPDKSRRI